jgi:RNA polymerase sigma factor (sigma-70 family)
MAVKNNTSRHTELVDTHLPLIRHIARGLSRTLPPSFPLEDLVQEGVIGLLRAATQYNPDAHRGAGFAHAVPFPTFARKAVRGAMIESVRRRHWTANTCVPIWTGNRQIDGDGYTPGGDAPQPACAPTQGIQAERRDLLRQVAEAATWLTADQRSILSLRYGSAEMTMPAIAEAMGQSLRWVAARHSKAIAELQARTGARSGVARRLAVVPPKPTKAIAPISIAAAAAASLEADRRKNFDELGELDQFFAPLKSKLARQKSLREWSRGLYDDADATRGFEVSGDRFTILIGARSNESTVDIPGLIKKIGVKLFSTFAKTTLKDLAAHVPAEVAASVTSVAQTGSRTVTSFERGTPAAAPAKKAA